MGFDAESFCNDYNVEVGTIGKQTRSGWVQITCPYCVGNPGYHGGFNTEGGYYNCWRCGFHSLYKIVSTLTGKNYVRDILKTYTSGELESYTKKKVYAEKCKLPPGCEPLHGKYNDYLINRDYDPEILEYEWKLKASAKVGFYKFRIVAPIYLHHNLISYQCRDITDRGSMKYLGCHEDDEVYSHQFTLYGIDKCKKDIGLCVEGITDVWRFGPGAVGLFGIDYTKPQILSIVKKFKRFFIFFDNDLQAQEQADKLYFDLSAFNIDCEILEDDVYQDPGEMKQDDAKHLMKELGI